MWNRCGFSSKTRGRPLCAWRKQRTQRTLARLLKRADECLDMAGADMDGAKVFMKRMKAILAQVRLWFELVSCRTVSLF